MSTTVLESPVADRLSPAKDAIRTILVHVQPEADAEPRLEAAADLARQLGATLHGVGAEMIPAEATTDPHGYLGGAWIAEVQHVLAANLKAAKTLFENNAKG